MAKCKIIGKPIIKLTKPNVYHVYASVENFKGLDGSEPKHTATIWCGGKAPKEAYDNLIKGVEKLNVDTKQNARQR